jgi:hypothetical protein
MSSTLVLPDASALADLRTYLGRADRIDRASVRLVAGDGVLAVYTAVLYPAGLLDETPTVLGLRTVAVDVSNELDAVVPITSLAERLRRLDPQDEGRLLLGLPAEVSTVTWAGVAPPRSNWRVVDRTTGEVLQRIAEDGIVEVAHTLPDDAGEHLVRRIRSEVWGRPIEGLEHVPAGAAFAAHSLGFLGEPTEQIPVYETGPWTRLSTERGHVLVKRRGWTLSGSTGPITLGV